MNVPDNVHITYRQEYVKCGKASCYTCHNEQGHGPYWYGYWREDGRLRSGYVGKKAPKAVVLRELAKSAGTLTEESRERLLEMIQEEV